MLSIQLEPAAEIGNAVGKRLVYVRRLANKIRELEVGDSY
jgi:hypothetical protein